MLEGPVKEEVVDVMRLRVRVVFGGEGEGWVTIAGNTGSKILESCENVLRVLKATALTEDVARDSPEVRSLSEGEIVEVLEWEKKKDEASDQKDEASSQKGWQVVKVKAKSDGAVGWVSRLSADGEVQLRIAS
eukprot:gnl/TRDRNA2_/TRDRNA2_86113_c0_seq2.p2 gnl/TRDRNA2_/TRDRNA2_86113_c0~~gnl/TRDRNA2_/TRDRNA2_86113_c0_seq2.p2  ORF type:complete len:133 (-),score=35.44 gnl/TRDRNA2_/TRDRNA2_86113_c0_seq2:94-492(-)